jgi:hypothetical protein
VAFEKVRKEDKEMTLEPEHRKKIEEIMGYLQCIKDFQCYKSGFEVLCKAQDIGSDRYLKCLESHPKKCPFSIGFETGHVCRCPVHLYF